MQQTISYLLHKKASILPFMKDLLIKFADRYEQSTGRAKATAVSAICGALSVGWFAILITSGV